jgi:predicted acylesterase/phospholipase RssA
VSGVDELETFALCLSGGGLRATFFHLGVIRALRQAGKLSKITHIFSVSGGSILAAHLALKWAQYNGSIAEFDEAVDDISRVAKRDIRGRLTRRWLLACTCPFLWPFKKQFHRISLLRQEYCSVLGRSSFRDIYGKPQLFILATSFTTGLFVLFHKMDFALRKCRTDECTLIMRYHFPLPLQPPS